MPRARIIDVDYYEFRKALREASARGAIIEKADADRWDTYVKTHNINEIGAMAIARGRFDVPTPVIIDAGNEHDGFYVYSEAEEACLRLVFQD